MLLINFTVYGEPKGKQRARTFNKNGITRTVTPQQTVDYETSVIISYTNAIKQIKETSNDPIYMDIKAYYYIPKNTSEKKRKEMLTGRIRPVKKPDADNVIKIIADALNKIAYKDDSQIVSLTFEKYYDEIPRVEVAIFEKQGG
jgi:Holliday junction resolvase RusA-like endonuclease